MQILFPSNLVINEIDKIEETIKFNNIALNPFDKSKIEFFSQLSTFLLKKRNINKIPELAAFAFWIRKSNILKLLSNFSSTESTFIVPRGIVFHIAPSNVDYMFLYSWFVSVLAGNKNILRLSSNYDKNILEILSLIHEFANKNDFEWFLNSNYIINYEHNDLINEKLSLMADCRIFWGGDETIKRMRKFDSKTTVKDIYFADKFSYSVIHSEYYLNTDTFAKEQLAINFFNDSYLFNQKACSSSQLVFFVGNIEQNSNASKLFWDCLKGINQNKQNKKATSLQIDHYLNYFLLASKNNVSEFRSTTTTPTVLNINKNDIASDYRTCGGGFFLESYINNLSDLYDFGTEADQTLSYFGFSNEELKNYILEKGSRSNLRIVPIGQSLNFDVIWDGYNLLNELIKIIKII